MESAKYMIKRNFSYCLILISILLYGCSEETKVEKYMNTCVKDMKKHSKEAFDEKKSVLACQQYYQTYPQMFVYWKGRIVTMDD